MGQEIKNFDFVITIDGEFIKTLYNAKIVHESNGAVNKEFEIKYHPGNLSMKNQDFDNMLSMESNGEMFLKFDSYKYSSSGEQSIKNYKIEIGKNWFQQMYLILKIYSTKNTSKLSRADRKRGYSFDIEYPSGAMIRVKK